MARVNRFMSESAGRDGMLGEIVYHTDGTKTERISQDIDKYKKHVKEQVDMGIGKKYRFYATIPDIVAIDIAERFGLDVHDPNVLNDENEKKRLKRILETHYPDLVAAPDTIIK